MGKEGSRGKEGEEGGEGGGRGSELEVSLTMSSCRTEEQMRTVRQLASVQQPRQTPGGSLVLSQPHTLPKAQEGLVQHNQASQHRAIVLTGTGESRPGS